MASPAAQKLVAASEFSRESKVSVTTVDHRRIDRVKPKAGKHSISKPTLSEVQSSWWWRKDSSCFPEVDNGDVAIEKIADTQWFFPGEKWAAICYETCARWTGDHDKFIWPLQYPLNAPWFALSHHVRTFISEKVWGIPVSGAKLVENDAPTNLKSAQCRLDNESCRPPKDGYYQITVDLNLCQADEFLLRDMKQIILLLRKTEQIKSPGLGNSCKSCRWCANSG